MNKKKLTDGQKYSYCYIFSNFTVLVLIYVVYVYFVFKSINFFLARIILYVIGYFVIGYFEERVLTRIVNPIVEFFIPKKWKRDEKERVDSGK